jgi:hypothetical protein
MRNQKGQIQIILVVMAVLAIIGVVVGTQFFGGSKKPKEPFGQTPSAATQEGPPIISDLAPSGKLPSGASSVTLSLTTNEPAFCRYSTTAGKEYGYMSDGFTADEKGTSHSAKVSGLGGNQAYKFYVRCSDRAGNWNDKDSSIEFQIGAGAGGSGKGVGSAAVPVPEAPPIRSNLKPTGALPSGAKETQVSLTTNEPAFCRYSTTAGKEYGYMSDGFSGDKENLFHSATIRGLVDNTLYEFYVRCSDMAGNWNNEDTVIRFGVGGVNLPPGSSVSDAVPPSRFSPSPTTELPVETRQTTISLKTDEKAVCKYSATAGVSYDAMSNNFSSTNSTTHSTEVTGLSEGASYNYYVKCIDGAGNKNTNDLTISFKVAAPVDNTPPVLSNPSHRGDVLFYTTTSVVISIATNEPAACRYSASAGTSYGSMNGSFSNYDQTKKFHVKELTGLQMGKAYDFYAKCSDTAGNVNTGDMLISFSIAS